MVPDGRRACPGIGGVPWLWTHAGPKPDAGMVLRSFCCVRQLGMRVVANPKLNECVLISPGYDRGTLDRPRAAAPRQGGERR